MTDLIKATVSQVLSPPEQHFGWWWIQVEVQRDDTGEFVITTLRHEYLSEVEKIDIGHPVMIIDKESDK